MKVMEARVEEQSIRPLFYIRIWFSLFLNSFHRAIEYRANFFSRVTVEICWMCGQIIFALAIGKGGLSIAGWTPMDMLFFFGMVLFIDAVYMILIHENLHEFESMMLLGTFDFYLLRPLNSMFLSIFRFPGVVAFVNLFSAIGVLVYAGLHRDTSFLMPQVFLGILYVFVGILLLLCFVAGIMCLGFWLSQTSILVWFFYEFYRLSFRPDDFYFSWLRRILLSIFPSAFFVSVPVKILLGKEVSTWMLVGPWILLAVGLSFVLSLWKRGVRRYDGAMS